MGDAYLVVEIGMDTIKVWQGKESRWPPLKGGGDKNGQRLGFTAMDEGGEGVVYTYPLDVGCGVYLLPTTHESDHLRIDKPESVLAL